MDIEIKPNIVSEQDAVEILNDSTIEQMLIAGEIDVD